jgi:23S rRNA (guanosine2251-2'-O)-methyltransferase
MDTPSRKRRNTGKYKGKDASKRPEKPLRSKGMKPRRGPNDPKRSSGSRSHGAMSEPRRPNRSDAKGRRTSPQSWIWGWHAVQAVLKNPRRTVHKILATDTAAQRLGLTEGRPGLNIVPASYIDKALPRGAAHQGVAVKAAPLEWPALSDLADGADDDALILVLDQITDPHNVGAMLRLASAFGATALVMQSRKAPPLAGATAKVAVGCIESVPVCLETNIAQTLQSLQSFGYRTIGLAGETDTPLSDAIDRGGRHAIVMGAEGPGLRTLVAKSCDMLARIPMQSAPIPGQSQTGMAESLNVATAAAIALYEVRR